MEEIYYQIFNADAQAITWWSMCIRGIIIFFLSLIFIKIGGKRIFGKSSAFDIALSIILGALLAKAIAGSAKFLPTLITCFVLVILHRIIAVITFKSDAIGKIIKGEENLLVRNGVFQMQNMSTNSITEKDIYEAMRSDGNINNITEIKEAYLERSGRISIVK